MSLGELLKGRFQACHTLLCLGLGLGQPLQGRFQPAYPGLGVRLGIGKPLHPGRDGLHVQLGALDALQVFGKG